MKVTLVKFKTSSIFLLSISLIIVTISLGCRTNENSKSSSRSSSANIEYLSFIDTSTGLFNGADMRELLRDDCVLLSQKGYSQRATKASFKEEYLWAALRLKSEFNLESNEKNKAKLKAAIDTLHLCSANFSSRSTGETAFILLLLDRYKNAAKENILFNLIEDAKKKKAVSIAEVENRSFLATTWLLYQLYSKTGKDRPEFQKEVSEVYAMVKSTGIEAEKDEFMIKNGLTGMLLCWEMMPMALLEKAITWDDSLTRRNEILLEKFEDLMNNHAFGFKYLKNVLPCLMAQKFRYDDSVSFSNSKELKLAVEKFVVKLYDGKDRKNCEGSQWFLDSYPLFEDFDCSQTRRNIRDNSWLYQMLVNLPVPKFEVDANVVESIGLIPNEKIQPLESLGLKPKTLKGDKKVLNFIQLLEEGKNPAQPDS